MIIKIFLNLAIKIMSNTKKYCKFVYQFVTKIISIIDDIKFSF
jgi:hypothetical protein